MKIAIFSGSIPSSTFIEHLIKGVSTKHQVYLFGVVEHPVTYDSKNIRVYKTPHSHLLNLCLTLWRLLLLGLQRPNDIYKLLIEVKKYQRFYDRWIWFSKFVPIILYKPDIIHLQWARDLDFYYFLKSKFEMKMVLSLRGAHINYTPIVEPRIADLYNTAFPHIDAFHAVSKAISEEAQNYGAYRDKISLIHSPIPSEFFDAFSPIKTSNSEIIRVIMVGRFHWIKGYKYALDALHILNNKGFHVQITIVGPDIMTEAINFQVHQLELQDCIILKPSLFQADLREALKGHDIFLLSSLKEGIANVVLEAMAIGLPVISTNCGGMGEVVKHKETGWLVPVRDPQAIADAILDVSQRPKQDLQRITQDAHDFVKAEFNAVESIRQFVDLYESVFRE